MKQKPLLGSRAWVIYLELLRWCQQHQTVPSEFSFFSFIKIKYPDWTRWQFRYGMQRLQDEGYIAIETTTRSIKLADLEISIRQSAELNQYLLDMFGDEEESL